MLCVRGLGSLGQSSAHNVTASSAHTPYHIPPHDATPSPQINEPREEKEHYLLKGKGNRPSSFSWIPCSWDLWQICSKVLSDDNQRLVNRDRHARRGLPPVKGSVSTPVTGQS
eukprot:413030-Rhodomonas_salina.1